MSKHKKTESRRLIAPTDITSELNIKEKQKTTAQQFFVFSHHTSFKKETFEVLFGDNLLGYYW